MSKLSTVIRKVRGRVKHLQDYRVHAPSWFEVSRPLSPIVGTAAEQYQLQRFSELDERFSLLLEEPQTLRAIDQDTVPLPAAADREGYFDDQHLTYWLSGLADLRMVQQLAPEARFDHVLDFGGASGRFARHVPLAYENARVTVAEMNINHVEWVEEHFGPAVRAVKVSPYPYFPLGDNTVTLCVGLSVFTHIDSYESGWLAEIYRVLQPGAYALLTIHSEDTWPLLPTNRMLFRTLQHDPDFRTAFRPGRPMPRGRLVYVFNPNSIEHSCNVFMDSDYVRSRWGKWFDVIDIVPRAHHDFQAAVVLRKG